MHGATEDEGAVAKRIRSSPSGPLWEDVGSLDHYEIAVSRILHVEYCSCRGCRSSYTILRTRKILCRRATAQRSAKPSDDPFVLNALAVLHARDEAGRRRYDAPLERVVRPHMPVCEEGRARCKRTCNRRERR